MVEYNDDVDTIEGPPSFDSLGEALENQEERDIEVTSINEYADNFYDENGGPIVDPTLIQFAVEQHLEEQNPDMVVATEDREEVYAVNVEGEGYTQKDLTNLKEETPVDVEIYGLGTHVPESANVDRTDKRIVSSWTLDPETLDQSEITPGNSRVTPEERTLI